MRSVAICGIGNVALDCARVLLSPAERFAPTDLAAHALAQLRGSSAVREVHLVARRGPVQVGARGHGADRQAARLAVRSYVGLAAP